MYKKRCEQKFKITNKINTCGTKTGFFENIREGEILQRGSLRSDGCRTEVKIQESVYKEKSIEGTGVFLKS